MSLRMLFDPDTTTTITTTWPDKPSLHRLPAGSPIPGMFGPTVLDDHLDTGCVPPAHLNVIKEGTGLDPAHYVTGGRINPSRLRKVRHQAGCTTHLRHLELWYPPAAAVTSALQRETGCTGYLSAFITPPGEQGLRWHWDQALGVIVQLAGTKRWELWRPVVDAPLLDHLSSVSDVWNPQWVQQWQDTGPDITYDLNPGDVLILPRGWVHNPHSRLSTVPSVHLTFVLRDRTPLWVAEQIIRDAIADARFRQTIDPATFTSDPHTVVDRTRDLLIGYLAGAGPDTTTGRLLQAAVTERDPDAA